MMSEDKHNLALIFIVLLILSETAVYVATTPRPREKFFQLYVLGANRLASDYYLNGDPNIRVGDLVRWYVGVTDMMGTVQLVQIRVKLGNSTINPPNDTQGSPSSAPLVSEPGRFIQDNETWETPFVWKITNATADGGYTRILEMQINNETYRLQDTAARNGYNFRLIFELWTWNIDSPAYQFGWDSGIEHRVAWLQVWFNMTSTR